MALYSDSQHAALPSTTVHSDLVELFPLSPAHFANRAPRARRHQVKKVRSNNALPRGGARPRPRPYQRKRAGRIGVDLVSIALALLIVLTLFLLIV